VTLINKPSLTTVSLGVSQFQGQWATDYGAEMAASVLVLLPQLIVFGLFQRQVIEGMTLGAVKG
jgi:raffinose/stachyose/melibiose transport system permease protein